MPWDAAESTQALSCARSDTHRATASALQESSIDPAGMSASCRFHIQASAEPGPISSTQATRREWMATRQSDHGSAQAICRDGELKASSASVKRSTRRLSKSSTVIQQA